MNMITFRRGFTLLETMIYVALLSLVVGLVIFTFAQMMRSHNQNQGRIDVESEINFLMDKFSWIIDSAQTINAPAAGEAANALSLNRYGDAQNPWQISLASSTIWLTKAGGPAAALTTSKVIASQLEFQHVSSTALRPAGVRVTLSLISNRLDVAIRASSTVTTTVYLRQ